MTKSMTKRLLFILPLLVLLFVSCDKTISREEISMSYNTPANSILPAEGGEITINVASTHSFRLSSSSSAMSFFKEGLVTYDKEGVAIVETTHTINVAPNETTEEKEMIVVARQLHNPEILSSLVFIQPAKEVSEEQ